MGYLKKYINISLLFDVVLFFILSALVFYFQRYVIYYRSQLPVFIFSTSYFKEFLTYPGGIAGYLAAFLRQFFIFPAAGALISTALTFSVSLFTVNFFASVNGLNKIRDWYWIPLLIFSLLNGLYQFSISLSVAVLLVLIFAHICLLLRNINPALRVLTCFFVGGAVYMIAGGLFLFFIFLVVIYEIWLMKTKRSKVYVPLIMLFYGVAYPFAAYNYLYDVKLKFSYLHLLPDGTDVTVLVLFTAYFLFTASLFLFVNVSGLVSRQTAVKKRPGKKWLLNTVFYTSVIVLFVLYNVFFMNKTDEVRLKVQYLADNSRWDEVLRTCKEEPVIDRLVSFQINRALYFTGKMGDEMFSYPQNYGVDGLFIDRINDNKMLEGSSDLYFDMGFINESMHWACEAFMFFGNRPHLLKRLALAHIINKRYKASEVFLNKLKQTLFYGEWADKYLRMIKNGNETDRDSLIAAKRRLMPRSDFFSDRQNPDIMMKFMLRANKKNKMAFEYLMSYYMLSNKFVSFYKNMMLYDVFNYFDKIPVNYQQALLVYSNITGENLPQGDKFKIDNDVIMDFRGYGAIIKSYGGNLVAARKSLQVNYGDTYWYYLNFVSPVTNKIEMEELQKTQSSYR